MRPLRYVWVLYFVDDAWSDGVDQADQVFQLIGFLLCLPDQIQSRFAIQYFEAYDIYDIYDPDLQQGCWPGLAACEALAFKLVNVVDMVPL